VAQVAVSSKIYIQHINTVWQIVQLLTVIPVGASHNEQALKG